jgi:tetrahydromethanopterin S-methyltransferase subunit D
MRRLLALQCVALVAMLTATAALAQRVTERYIPIGQSPGLSGKHTVIGTISAVDAKGRTLTCSHEAGTITMRVTDRTKVWLDRSKAKQSNLTGSFTDCMAGRRMEAKYVNNDRRPLAEVEWIKVQIGEPKEK